MRLFPNNDSTDKLTKTQQLPLHQKESFNIMQEYNRNEPSEHEFENMKQLSVVSKSSRTPTVGRSARSRSNKSSSQNRSKHSLENLNLMESISKK